MSLHGLICWLVGLIVCFPDYSLRNVRSMKLETSGRDKRGERGEGGGPEIKASPAAQAADGHFHASTAEEEEEEEVPDTRKS